MPPARWNDDRLDDLKQVIDSNNQRIKSVERYVEAHEALLTNFVKYGDRRGDRHFQIALASATWLLAIAAILTSVLR